MRWLWPIVVLVLLVALRPSRAEAHQPRLVSGEGQIDITSPQISQAFYATLGGAPQVYRVAVGQEMHLYVSLLVPDLPGQRTDFVLEVSTAADAETLLVRLEGSAHEWTPFYEPFGGDRYLSGPDAELLVPPGDYLLLVSNADNLGRYVLSVGREERFSWRDAVETGRRLPAVKRFFGRSPLTAYLNLVGVFMLLAVGGAALVVVVLLRWLVPVLRRLR